MKNRKKKPLVGDIWEYKERNRTLVTQPLNAVTKKEVSWINDDTFDAIGVEQLQKLLSRDGVEIKEWVTPTDEDAKNRPKVYVANKTKNGVPDWHEDPVTLYHVDEDKDNLKFLTESHTLFDFGIYEYCRMEKK